MKVKHKNMKMFNFGKPFLKWFEMIQITKTFN